MHRGTIEVADTQSDAACALGVSRESCRALLLGS